MKKFLALSVCLVVLTGCAIPLPLKLASWALDGISYLATGKSVTDHGISLIAQQDCALWRTVKGEAICSDYEDDSGTVIAAVETGPRISPEPEAVLEEARANATTEEPQPAILADQVAGVPGGEDVIWSDPAEEENTVRVDTDKEDPFKVLPLEDLLQGLVPSGNSPVGDSEVEQAVAFAPVEPESRPETGPKTAPEIEVVPVVPVLPKNPRPENSKARESAKLTLASAPSPANLFLVIGSFAGKTNARHLADLKGDLDPTVILSSVDGRPRYRVVVGPFSKGEKKNMRRRLKRAGIYDAWPMDLEVATWMEARRQPFYGNGEASQLAQVD